jgi:hypothetical protein
MIKTILDQTGNNRYQIRPHSGGLCFEIFEWKEERKHRDRIIPAGWVSLGKYPTTFREAYRLIAEQAARAGESEEVIRWCMRTSKQEAAYLDGWMVKYTEA